MSVNASIIDLEKYSLPPGYRGAGNIASIYPVLPRKKGNVPFDIYDYKFIINDEETKKLIREGRTIGCFYIESPGMRNLLKRLNVETFEMLTAVSSIIRPGVAESGMMQEFIARHRDAAKRTYFIPEMGEYLNETYGVMVYQEDVIKIAHHIAGLSLEEADLLRRAMSGKMRSHAAMKRVTEKFFDSCLNKGLSDKNAKELWRQISSFAGYSFCKAHSASFALLSFQVAFLKAHYPAEFMANVLNNGGGFYSSAVYIQEAKRFGIKVKLPCVNRSEYFYKGKGKEIRIGFIAVKHLSRNSAEFIVEERSRRGKYVSLLDFIIRTKLGPAETSILIKCGAMDAFGETRPTLLRLLDIYYKRRKVLEDDYNDLFMNETFALEEEIKTDVDYSIAEKCAEEYKAFDYMVTRHPLDFFPEFVNDPQITTAAAMNKLHGKRVRMIGWYISSKRVKTKKGDIMKFLSLEDLTGTFEAVIFPNVYMRVAEKTLTMGPYVVEGKVDAEAGSNLIVDKLEAVRETKINAEKFKDSSDDQYSPDDEGMREEDFYLAAKLDSGKLIKAYAG